MDYKNTIVASSREPEVLSTLAIIVNKLEGSITPQIPSIFEAVFPVTLDMITKDFHEFPEHRTNFYQFMQAVNTHCFPALCAIPSPQFKLVMNCIFWATKHTMRNVAEIGLDILFLLLQNVAKTDASYQQNFYYEYYKDTVHNILTVVTDTSHAAGLSMHSTILAYLFSIVEMGKVTVPLSGDPTPVPGFTPTANVGIIQEFVAGLLKSAFPHLTTQQIKITVLGMFQLNQNVTAFKEHVKDFLVQIRDFTGEDDSDLFLEEREKALMTAEAEKRKQQMTVPGIINPHDLPEEMQD
jgi:exportin-1